MAAAGAFVDLPGFVDSSYTDDHEFEAQVSVTGNTDTNSTLRIAWLIIILSLVGLWLLGYSFK